MKSWPHWSQGKVLIDSSWYISSVGSTIFRYALLSSLPLWPCRLWTWDGNTVLKACQKHLPRVLAGAAAGQLYFWFSTYGAGAGGRVALPRPLQKQHRYQWGQDYSLERHFRQRETERAGRHFGEIENKRGYDRVVCTTINHTLKVGLGFLLTVSHYMSRLGVHWDCFAC